VTASRRTSNSEPAVNNAVRTMREASIGFSLPCVRTGSTVHGIRVVNGDVNEAIAGRERRCGVSIGSDPVPPATVPPISGSYRRLAPHPRVLTTAADLKDLVSRINRPRAFRQSASIKLADQIAHDLAVPNDWDARREWLEHPCLLPTLARMVNLNRSLTSVLSDHALDCRRAVRNSRQAIVRCLDDATGPNAHFTPNKDARHIEVGDAKLTAGEVAALT